MRGRPEMSSNPSRIVQTCMLCGRFGCAWYFFGEDHLWMLHFIAGKDSDMSQWSRNGPAHIHTNMEIYIEFVYIYIVMYICMTDYIT